MLRFALGSACPNCWWLQMVLSVTFIQAMVTTLPNCLPNISTWMSKRHLRLHVAKSEFLIFPLTKPAPLTAFPTSADINSTVPLAQAKILEVIFYPSLSPHPRIQKILLQLPSKHISTHPPLPSSTLTMLNQATNSNRSPPRVPLLTNNLFLALQTRMVLTNVIQNRVTLLLRLVPRISCESPSPYDDVSLITDLRAICGTYQACFCLRAFALAAPSATSHHLFRSLLNCGLPVRPCLSPHLRFTPLLLHPRIPYGPFLLSLPPHTLHITGSLLPVPHLGHRPLGGQGCCQSCL